MTPATDDEDDAVFERQATRIMQGAAAILIFNLLLIFYMVVLAQ